MPCSGSATWSRTLKSLSTTTHGLEPAGRRVGAFVTSSVFLSSLYKIFNASHIIIIIIIISEAHSVNIPLLEYFPVDCDDVDVHNDVPRIEIVYRISDIVV